MNALQYRSVLVLLAFALCISVGCDRQPEARPPVRELVVLTPHNEQIQYAFHAGFASWYFNRRSETVNVKWVYRGTPQCVEYAQAAADQGPRDRSQDLPDLFFGGGILDHQAVKAMGLSAPLDLGATVADFPSTVAGLPTRDPDGHWYATGLSSFGILYNAAALEARGIAPPATWRDLGDSRFFGWLAVADPRASGSHRQCMALIVKHAGWEDGWSTLVRTLGNARALSPRSTTALDLVQHGQALATFCVNFDGLARVERSDGALRYIDPPDATAVTPDVISLLTTGQNPGLATDFIRFVLSPEGQELWAVKKAERRMPGETLYHYPIDPELFSAEKYAGKLSVTRNPFETDFGLAVDPQQLRATGELITEIVAATAPLHITLQQTWEKLIAADMPASAIETLTKLPLSAQRVETAASDAADIDIDAFADEWAASFKDQLDQAQP